MQGKTFTPTDRRISLGHLAVKLVYESYISPISREYRSFPPQIIFFEENPESKSAFIP